MPHRRRQDETTAVPAARETQPANTRRLPVDVDVFADRVVVRASLAGFAVEDVDVRASERAITICTTRPVAPALSERVTDEMYHGNWYRRLRIPVSVKPAAATVALHEGELTIQLPRVVPTEPSLANLPGGNTLEQTEIPLRSSADVMPPGPGPHVGVYKP